MNDSLWTVMEMPMKHRMMAEPACVVKELCFWLAWLCEWSYVVFLGFWEVLVIKQSYMYIVMCIYCIYFITPAWLESAPMYCVTVLFLASRQCHVVGIQVVQLRRSWALNVPLSCADCSASRTARATEWVKTWDLGTGERWTEPPWVLLFCSWVNVHMDASENWTCLPNRCKYSMSEEMSKISSENEDS